MLKYGGHIYMMPNYSFVYLSLDKLRRAFLCDWSESGRKAPHFADIGSVSVCVWVGCDLDPVTALSPRKKIHPVH